MEFWKVLVTVKWGEIKQILSGIGVTKPRKNLIKSHYTNVKTADRVDEVDYESRRFDSSEYFERYYSICFAEYIMRIFLDDLRVGVSGREELIIKLRNADE